MSAATVTRRRPFAALDLPLWAQMSDDDLDALSVESESAPHPQQHLKESKALEELGSAAASTTCSSPEARLSGRRSPPHSDRSSGPRWSDLMDAEDDDAEVSDDADHPAPGREAARSAELSADDEVCPAVARWSDLMDAESTDEDF